MVSPNRILLICPLHSYLWSHWAYKNQPLSRSKGLGFLGLGFGVSGGGGLGALGFCGLRVLGFGVLVVKGFEVQV